MKALVLGGCGFIGSHVVDALINVGAEVRVFDRSPEKFRKPVEGVEYIFGDFSNSALVAEALSNIDTVFHLITTTFPSTADLDPVTDITDNLINTIKLIELMQARRLKRLLYLSSGGTVYGIPKTIPVPEAHALAPFGSYGIVKATIEFYLMSFARRGIIDPVIIRASNPYGPRQGHAGVQGVISTFLNRIEEGKTINVWGDGSVVRDYVHVTELAALCVKAALSEVNGPINAGSGVGLSIKEIVEALKRTVGQDFETLFQPAQTNDVPVSILDISYAKQTLDWSPLISIDEGLADTYQWLRNHKSLNN